MPKDNLSASIALEMLVLTVLDRRGPSHGYDIANVLLDWSADAIRVQEGSLYPALHRMEEAGLVSAAWATTALKRRARIYRITRTGARYLADQRDRWTALAAGVARILKHA